MALDANARPGFPRSGGARVLNAPGERERAFAPFCRVGGSNEIASGLGLSMVEAISVRPGATPAPGSAAQQSRSGLRVTVTFPAVGKRGYG